MNSTAFEILVVPFCRAIVLGAFDGMFVLATLALIEFAFGWFRIGPSRPA